MLKSIIMDSTKTSQALMALNEKLDPQGLMLVKNSISTINDSNYDAVLAAISGLQNPTTVLIMSIFFGPFGVDRFMTGRIVSGIFKLLIGWLTLGIWWLVDIVKAKSATRSYNLAKLQASLAMLS